MQATHQRNDPIKKNPIGARDNKTCNNLIKEKDRQTDRQTDRRTDIQADKRTDMWTNTRTVEWLHRQFNG